MRYGGNTSSVELRPESGRLVILDAGTGIRPLGLSLRDVPERIDLLLTHLHLDHLEGLRFFAPLWDADVEIDVWGPPSPVSGLEERIARSFSPPLFPIDLRAVPARVTFRNVPREPWPIDGISLTAGLVMHPGPTVGFRVEAGGATFAYLPDHEPALAGAVGERPLEWTSGAAIAQGADVLVHDAQYAEDEYPQRIGWGHTSVADAIAFARHVGARRVLLFHHEPLHDDASLDRLESRVRALAGDDAYAALAREGMVVEL